LFPTHNSYEVLPSIVLELVVLSRYISQFTTSPPKNSR
jgi:hypothetical protein